MPLPMRIQALLRSSKVRSFGSAIAAFIGYGSWAYYANHSHGMFTAAKALLTQGGYSFLLTLSLSWIMEHLFRSIKHPQARFPMTFVSTCFLLYATAWGINALLGTPEILMTILPGAIIGTVYTYSYTLTLAKLHKTDQVGEGI